ncbi:hypothetical protein DFS33DRAFT_1388945 [Desarmillaria ectypa]|nr:hypothetical protein DFS33DRAFT_1388945 [Desarmillaria ectypa]
MPDALVAGVRRYTIQPTTPIAVGNDQNRNALRKLFGKLSGHKFDQVVNMNFPTDSIYLPQHENLSAHENILRCLDAGELIDVELQFTFHECPDTRIILSWISKYHKARSVSIKIYRWKTLMNNTAVFSKVPLARLTAIRLKEGIDCDSFPPAMLESLLAHCPSTLQELTISWVNFHRTFRTMHQKSFFRGSMRPIIIDLDMSSVSLVYVLEYLGILIDEDILKVDQLKSVTMTLSFSWKSMRTLEC